MYFLINRMELLTDERRPTTVIHSVRSRKIGGMRVSKHTDRTITGDSGRNPTPDGSHALQDNQPRSVCRNMRVVLYDTCAEHTTVNFTRTLRLDDEVY
jgi:hypothetical protein